MHRDSAGSVADESSYAIAASVSTASPVEVFWRNRNVLGLRRPLRKRRVGGRVALLALPALQRCISCTNLLFFLSRKEWFSYSKMKALTFTATSSYPPHSYLSAPFLHPCQRSFLTHTPILSHEPFYSIPTQSLHPLQASIHTHTSLREGSRHAHFTCFQMIDLRPNFKLIFQQSSF